MQHEFILSHDRAFINFTLKYCDTKQKLLSSYGFKRVVESFVKYELKKQDFVIYNYYVDALGSDDDFIDSLVEVCKLLCVFSVEEVVAVDNKYHIFFKDREYFLDLIDMLARYWKRLERYTIVTNSRIGEGLQNVRFNNANEMFNALILATVRRLHATVRNKDIRIRREMILGAMAGLTLNQVSWNCPIEYQGLIDIPFISTMTIQPPFIVYTKSNTRSGIFQEHKKNPLENLILKNGDWYVYPAKVGSLLTFVYFNKNFMSHGICLGNLFEIARENEYIGKKPDLIYVYGYEDDTNEKNIFYYKDKVNDMLIGYSNYCTDVDYFGYMKKMLLTLHNIRQIELNRLPIHGAMVNIVLRNGKESNIVIMGDSGAGKSESLEAFRTLNASYIRHMRVIFDDMGYLEIDNEGVVKAYGTEIGAFVRVDDLDPAYAFEQLDRGVYTNMDKVNARVTIPISSYDIIMRGYPIDYFLYANNYAESETKIKFLDNMDEMITVFEDGARKAKGTTSEEGLVKSYFANPFGPVQEREKTEKLVREYFKTMLDNGTKIGVIHTSLAIEGQAHEGPKKAAEELFVLINE